MTRCIIRRKMTAESVTGDDYLGRVNQKMRGLNVVVLSGNVGDFEFDENPNTGEDYCNFLLAVEKGRSDVTWVHVNVFGGNVGSCRKFLSKGSRVEIQGELMNRYAGGDKRRVMEVRCIDIKFLGRFVSSEAVDKDDVAFNR